MKTDRSDEEQFTKDVAIPMLHRAGFRRIRYVHGSDECGRDIVFFDLDRFGQEFLCGAQVKHGDLSGSQKAIIQSTIVPQLLEGLRVPYRDPETGRTAHVSRMYLLLSGRLIGTAKDQLHALLDREPNIVILDSHTINFFSRTGDIETTFSITADPQGRWIRTGGPARPLHLPLLTQGLWLEIDYKLGDEFCEAIEVSQVYFDPIRRRQNVVLHVPEFNIDAHRYLFETIYRYFEEAAGTLWME